MYRREIFSVFLPAIHRGAIVIMHSARGECWVRGDGHRPFPSPRARDDFGEISVVMPGLVPGTHVLLAAKQGVGGRDKPGHDALGGPVSE